MSRTRGFTLVELLAAITIIGILSAIGIYSFSRYLRAAETNEARAVLADIRSAESNYKSETLGYLDCSGSLANVYPQTSAPDSRKWAWSNPGHSQYDCWRQLHVDTDGPVMFGYSVIAGPPGAVNAQGLGVAIANLPATSPDAWFLTQAAVDRDGDGRRAVLVTSSWQAEIAVQDEVE